MCVMGGKEGVAYSVGGVLVGEVESGSYTVFVTFIAVTFTRAGSDSLWAALNNPSSGDARSDLTTPGSDRLIDGTE